MSSNNKASMRRTARSIILGGALLVCLPAGAAAPAAPTPLGSVPEASQLPRAEFVFEERVTLSPAVVLGDRLHHRHSASGGDAGA